MSSHTGHDVSESAPDAGVAERSRRHFRLSPPRHFVYPAILLLLSEKPRHGYTLMYPLVGLGFGPIDRPTVYRALADLENDGLLKSWSAEPKAGGTTRHVYAPTEEGRHALEDWMAVLGGERDRLDVVLERYAALAYGPNTAHMRPERPITWPAPGRLTARAEVAESPPLGNRLDELDEVKPAAPPGSFVVAAHRSAVLIRARSNVGPIEFGTNQIEGSMRLCVRSQRVVPGGNIYGHVQVPVGTLTSGNALYDDELLRRIDARRFPLAVITLDEAEALGSEDRFGVRGRMTFHGVTRPLCGVVGVAVQSEERIIVSGEQVIDIRDFEVGAPSLLKFKIYPDVRVYLHLEAEAAPWG